MKKVLGWTMALMIVCVLLYSLAGSGENAGEGYLGYTTGVETQNDSTSTTEYVREKLTDKEKESNARYIAFSGVMDYLLYTWSERNNYKIEYTVHEMPLEMKNYVVEYNSKDPNEMTVYGKLKFYDRFGDVVDRGTFSVVVIADDYYKNWFKTKDLIISIK